MSVRSSRNNSLMKNYPENLKSVAREIMRLCSKKNIIISNNCANYLVKLIILSPEFNNGDFQGFSSKNLKKLEELCMEKCTDSVFMETIQMQIYFISEVFTRDELAKENQDHIRKNTDPIKSELFRRNYQTTEDFEKAFHTLVTLIVLNSEIGDLTSSICLRETAVALQSVLPSSELSGLLAKPLEEKEEQLRELTAIVSGIRLFNRDCNKGGQYIEDAPQVLFKEIDASKESIRKVIESLEFKIDRLTCAVENYFCIITSQPVLSHIDSRISSAKSQTGTNVSGRSSIGDNRQDSESVKDILILARQFEFFLRSVAEDVHDIDINAGTLKEKLESCLSLIYNTVKNRTAIPTVEIYPQFIDLFNIWKEIKSEINVINYVNSVIWNLKSYTQALDSVEDALLRKMIGEDSFNKKKDATQKSTIPEDEVICNVITEKNTTDFDELPLELNGFCIWCFVHGKGALIPGDPSIGLCEYNGFYYSFATHNAAIKFGKEPKAYLSKANSIIKEKSVLRNLIKIQDQIPISVISTLREDGISDKEVQTEVHPIRSYIDRNYSWNEWDYRRGLLKLVHLKHCQTKSSQTTRSSWREVASTQFSYPHKNKSIQTKVDAATSMPHPRRFAYGLRAKTLMDSFHMLDLTAKDNE